MKPFIKHFAYIFILFVVASCTENQKSDVTIAGAMKNVMRKGELQGTIYSDTIANKNHLYGLGPVEYLSGELMIFDGKCYKSTVTSPTTMNVEETFDVKAPFFGYASVNNWESSQLPDSIINMKQLEHYIDKISKKSNRPFMFKISGMVDNAKIHVVNLPKGTAVRSHNDAHTGLTRYEVNNEKVDIVGFFSTEHKAILTHHDTFMHLHLLTEDRKQMGHLDEIAFKPGSVILYTPKQ